MAEIGGIIGGALAGALSQLNKEADRKQQEKLAMLQLLQKAGTHEIAPANMHELQRMPFFQRLIGNVYKPIGGQPVIPFGGGAITARQVPMALSLGPEILAEQGLDPTDPAQRSYLSSTPASTIMKARQEAQLFKAKAEYGEDFKMRQGQVVAKRAELNKLRTALSAADDDEHKRELQEAILVVNRADPNNVAQWDYATQVSARALPKMRDVLDTTTNTWKRQQRGPLPPLPGTAEAGPVQERPGPFAPTQPAGAAPPAAAPAPPAAAPEKPTYTPTDGHINMNRIYGVPLETPNVMNLTSNQMALTKRTAEKLGIKPEWLWKVIGFETGGTFDPKAANPRSSGTGLIQFMEDTAQRLGTSTENLKRMTYEQQLAYVEAYFRPFAGKLNTLEDVYMAVLSPKHVGAPPDAVVFQKGVPDARGRDVYGPNAEALDLNGDGKITVAEATQAVVRHGQTAAPAATPVPAVTQVPGAVTPATPAPGQTTVPGPQQPLAVPPAGATPGAPPTPVPAPAPAPGAQIPMTPEMRWQYEREQQTNKEQREREARQEAHQRTTEARQVIQNREAARTKLLDDLKTTMQNVAPADKAKVRELIGRARKAGNIEEISQIRADTAEIEEAPPAAKPPTREQMMTNREQVIEKIHKNAVVGREAERDALLDEVYAIDFADPQAELKLLKIRGRVEPVDARVMHKGPDGRDYPLTPNQVVGRLQQTATARESARRWNKQFTVELRKYADANLDPQTRARVNELLLQGDEKFDDAMDFIIASPQQTFEVYDPVLKQNVALNRTDALKFQLKYAPQLPAEVDEQLAIKGLTLNSATPQELAEASAAAAAKKEKGAVAYFNAMEGAKVNAPVSQEDSLFWVHPQAMVRKPATSAPSIHPRAGGIPSDLAKAGYIMVGTKGMETINTLLDARGTLEQMHTMVADIFGPDVDPNVATRVWKTVTDDISRVQQDPLGRKIQVFEGLRLGLSSNLAKSVAKEAGHFSDADREAILSLITPTKMAGYLGLANSRKLAEEQFDAVYTHIDKVLDRATQGEYAKFKSTGHAPGATAPEAPQSTPKRPSIFQRQGQ